MTSPAQPVRPEDRILLLDVLRGFALTGVLLVNMMGSGAFGGVWDDVHGLLDQAAVAFEFLFVRERFWHLFSFLFGVGFAIQWRRAEDSGTAFLARYLRRLVGLFAFGAFTNILFRLDVLTDYAVLGVLLIAFRRWPPRVLLALALATQLAPAAVTVIRGTSGMSGDVSAPAVVATPSPGSWQATELRLRWEGTFVETVAAQAGRWAHELRYFDLQPSITDYWTFFAMFVLGMWAVRVRFFTGYENHRAWARTAAVLGLIVGVVGVTLAWREEHGGPVAASALAAGAAEGTVLLGYTGWMVFSMYVVAEWVRSGRSGWLLRGLASVGRTALTNYLVQNALVNVFFMAWGMGLWGAMQPAAALSLSVACFVMLMAASHLWLSRFRFGPAEWVWRSMTYGRMQRLRRDDPDSSSPGTA